MIGLPHKLGVSVPGEVMMKRFESTRIGGVVGGLLKGCALTVILAATCFGQGRIASEPKLPNPADRRHVNEAEPPERLRIVTERHIPAPGRPAGSDATVPMPAFSVKVARGVDIRRHRYRTPDGRIEIGPAAQRAPKQRSQ